jgi:hypothetical protein
MKRIGIIETERATYLKLWKFLYILEGSENLP